MNSEIFQLIALLNISLFVSFYSNKIIVLSSTYEFIYGGVHLLLKFS